MRRRICSLACAGFAIALFSAAPALSTPTPTANVPQLAWRGDSLKLAQCDIQVTYDGDPISLEDTGVILSVRFMVEDWSGSVQSPVFVDTGTNQADATPYADADFADTGEYCVASTLTALSPGLASVTLAATLTTVDGPIDPSELERFAIEPDPAQREFLAAWMTLTAPVLVNLGTDSDDGRLDFGGMGDVLRATVKGILPLGNDFAGMVPGDLVTLPDDWNQLAQRLADDPGTATPGSNPFLWDVHDDTLATTGHVAGSVCPPPLASLVDAVENCTGGGADGPFSNATGSLSATPTVGPFDPLRLGATMLGDGKVDAGDAPMPAARVEAIIAPGGVGSLQTVAKSQAYSRDATGAANPGNLFAPFYSSFVPATAADPAYSSGTTKGGASNFPDTSFAPYVYWEPFAVTTRSGGNACRNPLGTLYEYPGGAESTSVYTDEHGEARIRLSPGVGLLLTPDAQSRCDLGLYGTEAPPNAVSVVARAHYPEPIPGAPNLVSTALAFLRQNERAGSSLDCLPKGVATWACFHRISGPNGQPLAGAAVRVSSDLAQVTPDSLLYGGFDSRGQTLIGVDPNEQWATLGTNAAGTVGFDVRLTLNVPFEAHSEEIGTRNGGPGVSRTVTLQPAAPDPDLDDDGIANDVDPNPGVASADFSDGTGTTGTIADRGGLTVTVANATPGGVTITTSGAGGPATVTACAGFTVTIAAGSSITLTCGSITLAVATGSATIVLGGGLTTVTVPAGASARVALTPSGSYTVASLAGTVALVVDGVTTTIAPGPPVTVQVWNFTGFFAIDPPPALNRVQAGDVIPLSWRLTDAAGLPVTTLKVAKLRVTTKACSLGTTPNLPAEAILGKLTHLGGGFYGLAWKTPKSYRRSCKTLYLDIGDGVTHTALFALR